MACQRKPNLLCNFQLQNFSEFQSCIGHSSSSSSPKFYAGDLQRRMMSHHDHRHSILNGLNGQMDHHRSFLLTLPIMSQASPPQKKHEEYDGSDLLLLNNLNDLKCDYWDDMPIPSADGIKRPYKLCCIEDTMMDDHLCIHCKFHPP